MIDLNCDMGEGLSEADISLDAALMDYVTSVNIACGFHAGSPTMMRRTIENAIKKGIKIGAHPGYDDRENFGRTEMRLSPDEVFEIVLYQVSALKGMAEALGGKLHHVKPHGALYNQAAKDAGLAAAIARAVAAVDDGLVFYGLSGSYLISEAEKLGLNSFSEVFADRTYQPDGSLTPRSQLGALVVDTEKAVAQVLEMVNRAQVTAVTGEKIPIRAETICIHGDGEKALEFARAVSSALNGFSDAELAEKAQRTGSQNEG